MWRALTVSLSACALHQLVAMVSGRAWCAHGHAQLSAVDIHIYCALSFREQLSPKSGNHDRHARHINTGIQSSSAGVVSIEGVPEIGTNETYGHGCMYGDRSAHGEID